MLACMSKCEMLSDIYGLAVTTILIMNMQETVFNTYCGIEINTRIWAEYRPSYVW